MARYEAAHLRQTTGAHDETYWSELVAGAVAASGLVVDDADRPFDTAAIHAVGLAAAAGHHAHLLHCAVEGDDLTAPDGAARAAMGRLSPPEDDLAQAGARCVDEAPRRGADTDPDTVRVAHVHLLAAVAAAPTNWSLPFRPLRQALGAGRDDPAGTERPGTSEDVKDAGLAGAAAS